MAEREGQLRDVLDGYAKYLQDKNLAMDKHQSHLVRWVRAFLLFARAHTGYSFAQTLECFRLSDDRYAMRRTRSTRRALARWLTVGVALSQAALLGALWADRWQPGRGNPLDPWLWAWVHKPSFHLLLVAGVGGGVMTWAAWAVRGPHRRWLIVSWALFIPLLAVFHADRMAVMLRVVVRQLAG